MLRIDRHLRLRRLTVSVAFGTGLTLHKKLVKIQGHKTVTTLWVKFRRVVVPTSSNICRFRYQGDDSEYLKITVTGTKDTRRELFRRFLYGSSIIRVF